MATKRIRCICGTIYAPAVSPVCPSCQAPPPTAQIPAAAPPLEPVPNPIMLDSDRKKRPHLYVLPSPKKTVLACSLLVLLIGGWFIIRPHSKPVPVPHDDTVKTKTNSAEKKPLAAPSPEMATSLQDLAASIAKAKPGATIKLPAGTYPGSFTIDRAIHLIGDSTNGEVIIENGNTAGIVIAASDVILENLQFTGSQAGNFPALKIRSKAVVELRNCLIDTPTSTGVLVVEGGKITANKTTFSTRGQGSGCQLEEASLGELTDCIFQKNRWGYTALTAAEGYATKCRFEQNGMDSGQGAAAVAEGEKSNLALEDCTLTDNLAGVYTNKKGGIILTGCTLQNNQFNTKAATAGLIAGRSGGRFLIKNCTFESNNQGIILLSGSTAQIDDCKLSKIGFSTEDEKLLFYSDAISLGGQGTQLIMRKTSIDQSPESGINVVEAAHLEMEDIQITQGEATGITAGANEKDRTEVVAVRCQITGNKVDGIGIYGDTIVKISSSSISRNNGSGIYISGEKATVLAENSDILENRSVGVFSALGGTAFVINCSLLGNKYGAQSGVPDEKKQCLVTLDYSTVSRSTKYGVIANNVSKLILSNSIVSDNKQNRLQARGGTLFEQSEPSKTQGRQPKADSSNPAATPQTGGMTGMVDTTPYPTATPPDNSDDSSTSGNPKPQKRRTPTPRKPTSTGNEKANEVIRNVLRYLPHR